MIIHTLKMCCILNPFFTETPTRRKKKVPSQRAVPPAQLSQPLKRISVFVCLFHEYKLTFTCLQNTSSERCVDYKPTLLWAELSFQRMLGPGKSLPSSPSPLTQGRVELVIIHEELTTSPTPAGDSNDNCYLHLQIMEEFHTATLRRQ